MNRLLLQLLLLFLFSNLKAQNTFKNQFDLGLLKIDNCDRNWVSSYSSTDFQQKTEKKDRFLSVLYSKGINKTMSFTLSRIIVFPKIMEGKDLQVGFETQGNTNFPLSVEVISYDDNETELETSSIQVKVNSKWKKNKVSIGKGKIAAIKIMITYMGDHDPNQVVSFRNISLKYGGKDFTESIIKYPIDSTHVVFDKSFVKPLKKSENQFENPISNIDDIKVIGLGEITHGSKDIKDARNLFIKNLISDYNCKLVLLEVPFDFALLMNLYVTDKLDQSGKDRLRKNMDLLFFGMGEFDELLEWIRKYNSSNSKQVKIFGIDNAAELDGIDYALMDYHMHLFGKEPMLPYLTAFMKDGAQQAMHKIIADQVIYKALSKKDIEFYKYFIYNYQNQKIYPPNIKGKLAEWNVDRDENMFKRVLFLDSLYRDEGEKLVVLAHSWHLKKNPLITGLKSEKMLGNYLDSFYKNSYFSINFTFGTGTFLQDNCRSFRLTTDTIHKPVIQSLESYAYQLGTDFFYFPTDKLNTPPNQMLGIPRYKLKSDYSDFGNVKKRYDAIVFLRNVIALNRHGYNSFSASHFYSKDREKEYSELLKEMDNKRKDIAK